MPADVMIDLERKLVITVCSGVVTDEEFMEARKQLLADPAFDPAFDRMWDFSGVIAEQVSEEAIARLVKSAPFVGDISRAVVMSMSPKALARIMEFVFQSRQLNRRIAVFPTRQSAEQWIESEQRARTPAQEQAPRHDEAELATHD
jgi:hypothetical protein